MMSAGPAPESRSGLEMVEDRHEGGHRGSASPGHPGDLVGTAQCLAEGDPMALGEPGDVRLRPVPDPALGHVEDPAQADVVGRVGHDPQVGQDVADLAALVEARAAHDLVRQPGPDEHLLQGPGLGIGPVEHRDVTVPGAGRRRRAGRSRCRRTPPRRARSRRRSPRPARPSRRRSTAPWPDGRRSWR